MVSSALMLRRSLGLISEQPSIPGKSAAVLVPAGRSDVVLCIGFLNLLLEPFAKRAAPPSKSEPPHVGQL